MKRYISTVIFVLTLCSVTYAQLSGPLSGVITAGTYTVEGEISVEAGDTLVIEPGTVFNFQGHYKFIINGWLFAEGTEADSITFTAADTSEGWHGIRFIDAPDSSRLSYCVLEYGRATGSEPDNGGGAINCQNSSPVITACTISGNSAVYGGGILCLESSPSISNCTINVNTAVSIGGGIFCSDSSPVITDCTISGNTAAEDDGGGICIYGYSPAITDCIISGNTAAVGGGAYCYVSSPTFTGCTFSGNMADWGSGIYIGFLSDPSIINIIVEGNFGGYGVYWTLSGISYGSVSFSDFYNNESGNLFNPPSQLGTIVSVNANGDSCDTFMNIFEDPLFVDPANDDYHLTEGSPCIDAGDPESPLDPDSTRADMGAYYFDQSLGVREQLELRPYSFSLSSYPNPFNPSTTISFDLPIAGEVSLIIYDIRGREVRVLHTTHLQAGQHEVVWNAEGLASGLYFAKLDWAPAAESRHHVETRKMVLVK